MANVETITACENVCRDFGTWFPNFTTILADIATIIAVFIAAYAANEWSRWKKQVIAHRGHNLALDAVEELRTYEALLNAARYSQVSASEYNKLHFDEAHSLLKQAADSRIEIVRLCRLVDDLGLGTAAKDAAHNLIHCEGKISGTLKMAHDAHDRSNDERKLKYLVDFFWSPGVDTELSLEVEKCQEKLRKILLGVVRLS